METPKKLGIIGKNISYSFSKKYFENKFQNLMPVSYTHLDVYKRQAENHCTIFTVAESPKNEKIIWAGTDDGNVQVTQNGGQTWNNVTANIPNLPKNTWVHHIEASSFAEGTAYAVFDGHNTGDYNTYVYKTKDFGKTWTSISTPDIKGFARNLQEDFKNEELLFLGTEKGLYITLSLIHI